MDASNENLGHQNRVSRRGCCNWNPEGFEEEGLTGITLRARTPIWRLLKLSEQKATRETRQSCGSERGLDAAGLAQVWPIVSGGCSKAGVSEERPGFWLMMLTTRAGDTEGDAPKLLFVLHASLPGYTLLPCGTYGMAPPQQLLP